MLDLIPTAPPPLTLHLRENLIRGLRATIRRDEYWLAQLGRSPAGATAGRCAALMDRIAASTANLRDLEGL